MTITECIAALANRLNALEARVTEVAAAPASSTGRGADLERALEEVASLRSRLGDLTALVQSTAATVAALRQGVEAAQAVAANASEASESLRSDLKAVRFELDAVRQAQGDLAVLEQY